MAGSRKGVPNKPKRALLALLNEQYPGFSPVLQMVKMYHESEDRPERVTLLKEIAQYVTPKLKAVEVQLEGQVDARISWCDPHTIQSEAITGGTASET